MANKFTLITGCFDIVHLGHLKLFEFAKTEFPDRKLIIALDSDERVKLKKGINRPINNLTDRTEFIKSATNNKASIVWIKNDDDLIRLCRNNRPLRILGSDYKGKPIVGQEECLGIIYFDRIEEHSTTNIIKRINE